MLRTVPVDDYAHEAGLDPQLVRRVAREYAQAERACVRTDLGLEHSPHSTLNTYLAKLLFLLTGHFGKPGTNVFHSSVAPLVRHSKDPGEGGRTTKVTGAREIGGLYPPNVLPLEIDTDHPERIRAVVVESGNPLVTGADTRAYRDAFAKLDLLVVIDVAMTETARLRITCCRRRRNSRSTKRRSSISTSRRITFTCADLCWSPRENRFPNRKSTGGSPWRWAAFPERFPLLAAVARLDRAVPRLRLFPLALALTLRRHPKLGPHLPLVLHETLSRALPNGARSAAVIWGLCQKFVKRYGKECIERAGIKDEGAGLAEALFQRILNSPSGTLISVHDYADTWSLLKHPDGKIHLAIPEMLEEISQLEPAEVDADYPFVLQAGERRSYNANTIYREAAWRKQDPEGALKVHPQDASRLGLTDGGRAWCESPREALCVRVAIADEVRPGLVSLPHGYGMYAGKESSAPRSGPAINFLTDSDHCDALSKVPFHKHVHVRVRPVGPEENAAVGEIRESALATV